MSSQETLLDLLELYTHHRTNTTVGPQLAPDTFLEVRIPLNQEVEHRNLPRFTEWKESKKTKPVMNGNTNNGRLSNGSKPSPKDVSPRDVTTPNQPPTQTSSTAPNGTPRAARVGERGRDGTVRFMLNPDREQDEKNVVAEYFKPEEVEVEPEPELPRSPPRPRRRSPVYR